MFQKLIIILGAIALLAIGYFLFVQQDQFSLNAEDTNPLADQVLAKTQVFIQRRASLDAVEISPKLFSDARFTSLRSYTSNLSDQSLGKSSLFDLPAGLTAPEAETAE